MNNFVGKMFMHFFVIINSFLYSIIVVSSSNDAAITKPRRVVTKIIHRDSIHSPYYNPGATTSEHARWATESSMARFTYLKARIESALNNRTANDVQGGVIPIDTGSVFLVNFSIGEPPVPQLVVMDTGSSLSWVQCLPCTECFEQLSLIYDPSKSTTYEDLPCTTHLCYIYADALCDSLSRCTYRKVYLDNTTTQGHIAFEKLTFVTSDEGTTSVPGIVFGCGQSNNILVGKTSGVMGLGYDYSTSLPFRLGSKFSYCIGNINDPYYNHNLLIIGDGAYIEGYSTPIAVHDDKLYHLTLEGISVGDKRLDISGDLVGKDRVVIDSSSTDTLLAMSGFEPLKAEVQYLIGGLLTQVVVKKPGYLCYRGVVGEDLKGFPVVTFHFAGGADFVLDIDNMFRQVDTNVFCMAVIASRLPNQLSILGIIAQQNYNIGYDLNNMKLYFQRIDCELLED